jgi:hypothetical protein
MRTRTTAFTILTFIALGSTQTVCAEEDLHRRTTAPMRIVGEAEGYWFYEGEQRIMFYQRARKSFEKKWTRANYVHPLYDLSGNVVTEDFPADHRHHRGIFWAWHQVWIRGQRMGDPWICQDFDWDVVRADVLEPGDDSAALRVQVFWNSPHWKNDRDEPVPFVNETTTIRAYRQSPNARAIDFDIRLQALVDGLRIGGSEDDKGYGGFSPRFRLPENVEFRAQTGAVEPLMTAVAGGPWMDIWGRYAGADEPSGVAILCHPIWPDSPQPWILRAARSMQNAVHPGRHPVPLTMEDPWRLHYRLLLHRGDSEPAKIQSCYEQYIGANSE